MAKHNVRPLGATREVDGELVDHKYGYGKAQIEFRQGAAGSGVAWYVRVTEPGFESIEQIVTLPPAPDYARIVGDCIHAWRVVRAEENILVLNTTFKLNKKFDRATTERIFESKGGWGSSRKTRVIDRLRDGGLILLDGDRVSLTADGASALLEQNELLAKLRGTKEG